MEPMGYDNVNKVFDLSGQGKLLTKRAENITLNPMALSMLVYMAAKSYDWPPKGKADELHLPCRVYQRGWENMARDFGMLYVAPSLLMNSDNPDDIIRARHHAAMMRLSKSAGFLQEQGLIRQIRRPDIRSGSPAAWLLLLGDDEENRKAEQWARECLDIRH